MAPLGAEAVVVLDLLIAVGLRIAVDLRIAVGLLIAVDLLTAVASAAVRLAHLSSTTPTSLCGSILASALRTRSSCASGERNRGQSDRRAQGTAP